MNINSGFEKMRNPILDLQDALLNRKNLFIHKLSWLNFIVKVIPDDSETHTTCNVISHIDVRLCDKEIKIENAIFAIMFMTHYIDQFQRLEQSLKND